MYCPILIINLFRISLGDWCVIFFCKLSFSGFLTYWFEIKSLVALIFYLYSRKILTASNKFHLSMKTLKASRDLTHCVSFIGVQESREPEWNGME